MAAVKRRFLAELGAKIVSNGYSIIPIKPGEKAPYGNDWQKLRVDRSALKRLIDKYPDAGVGILTYNAPFIDLDIPDGDICDHMERWIALNICDMDDYIRVGSAPRRGIPFRADDAFAKLTSTIYVVPDLERALPAGFTNDQHKKVRARIEILGAGQQYVSRHIHPDTGEPYSYPRGGAPEQIARDDLPLLTQDVAQRVIDEFHRVVTETGWRVYRANGTASGSAGDHSLTITHIPTSTLPVEMDEEDIELTLMTIPAREDYNGWLEIGAALHHQYRGGARGLELWDKHSAGAMGYDPIEIERKWESFGKERDGRLVTFRTLIEAAKQYEAKRITEAVEDVRVKLAQATHGDHIKEIVKLIKTVDFDPLAMTTVISEFRAAFKRISGAVLSPADAKRMLRRQDLTTATTPPWAEGWYFLSDDTDFYHYATRRRMKRESFNATFDRQLISKMERLEGKAIPETHASDLALNLYEIPTAANTIFWPGQPESFSFEGRDYVNGFSEASLPELPKKLNSDDRLAIRRFLAHLEHLIKDQGDREAFLAWYAYIARTLRRPNYAVVLQGTEGDGKTTLFTLMGSMLGSANVRPVDTTSLETVYTDWSHGTVFACVEEIYLIGQNRGAVLNRIKPMITNDVINVHPKGKTIHKAVNTQSYLLLTNHANAMPISEDNSRYLIIMSRWQSAAALEAFRQDNPDYYANLADMATRGPAIRKWLIEEYELPAKFDPHGRAPRSAGKVHMAQVSKSEVEEQIIDLIAESDSSQISETLLNAALLRKLIMDTGYVAPSGPVITNALLNIGFQFLGRYTVLGTVGKFWSKTPDRFKTTRGVVDAAKIREWAETDI